MPTIKTYTFDDLVAAMNAIAPYDWRAFFRERLDSTSAHAPVGGLTAGGWEMAYTEQPNEIMAASQAAHGEGNYSSSIGLVVRADGTVQDAIPGMPAFQSGISPYTKIVAVDGHDFSLEALNRALSASTNSTAPPIVLLISNAGFVESHELAYHGGLRYPHIIRSGSGTDYLEKILQPKAEAH
jgi:predicted metalloprotease with PDZ domain